MWLMVKLLQEIGGAVSLTAPRNVRSIGHARG